MRKFNPSISTYKNITDIKLKTLKQEENPRGLLSPVRSPMMNESKKSIDPVIVVAHHVAAIRKRRNITDVS